METVEIRLLAPALVAGGWHYAGELMTVDRPKARELIAAGVAEVRGLADRDGPGGRGAGEIRIMEGDGSERADAYRS